MTEENDDFAERVLFSDEALTVAAEVFPDRDAVKLFFALSGGAGFLMVLPRETAYALALTLEEQRHRLDPHDDFWYARDLYPASSGDNAASTAASTEADEPGSTCE